MSKAIVNMTPNPLDIQTIHCSQGDTEAREWGFELHNNGEKIDSSSISDQLVFKAYEGGTEEILPTNGSTPTTSPFKGDIKYPQGLLSGQEFLYRESPTEEDGNANIKSLYGNTLVWNQLVQNGNFADTSKWTKGSGASSLAISNNEAVITIGGTWNNDVRQNQGASFISGHKYFASFEAKASVPMSLGLATINVTPEINFAILTNAQTTFKKIASIATAQTNATDFRVALVENGSSYIGETFTVRNIQIIDLTAMGLDITDPSDFTSLFPLSYYSYNQGSLLSFNGNGIKTVGFNQWDEEWELGSIDSNGQNTPSTTEIRSKNYIPVILGETYYIKQTNVQVFHFYDGNLKYLGNQYIGESRLLNIPSGTEYIRFRCANTYGTSYKNDICLNISDPSKNGTYEPYTSSTLSLPISTYFPNGMKSAGNVYDELTPNKAITRVGAVDLGSLTYSMYQVEQGNLFRSSAISNAKLPYDSTNIRCALYPTLKASERTDKCVSVGSQVERIDIIDSSFSDVNAFKSAMSGVYALYELATPTETSFTTASLVTENAEIPLSNEDGVLVGKCTEQLSAEPGFHDAKIKLSDGDGECYSNKIQLHVERSPQ